MSRSSKASTPTSRAVRAFKRLTSPKVVVAEVTAALTLGLGGQLASEIHQSVVHAQAQDAFTQLAAEGCIGQAKSPAPSRSSAACPVLAATHFRADGVRPETLSVGLDAPGSDYGVAGRESTAVSVFVDGRYQSSEMVLRERSAANPTYTFNLGVLARGAHQLEVRAAQPLGSPRSPAARLVSAPVVSFEDGLRAVLERHAPRLLAKGELSASGQSATLSRTDVPVDLRAAVLGELSGPKLLLYSVNFTDEDADDNHGLSLGSKADADRARMDEFHYTNDDEWVFAVAVDANGDPLSAKAFARLQQGGAGDPQLTRLFEAIELSGKDKLLRAGLATFQHGHDGFGTPYLHGHLHETKPFAGAYVGEQPVLRVSTKNNNFEQVTAAQVNGIASPTWSPRVRFDPGLGSGVALTHGVLDARGVSARSPWIAEVAALEIAREDGAAG